MENSLEVFHRRLEQAEERFNEPEDKMTEIIKCEEQKIQRKKKSEWTLRNLRHTTKRVHVLMMSVPVEKRKGWKFKEIMAENFREAQQTPNRIDSKKSLLTNIVTKF